MTIDEIEIGQEVICIDIDQSAVLPSNANRVIGHIGKVESVYPLGNTALVSHTEYVEHGETGYLQYLIPFLINELSIYEPDEKPLQLTIKNILKGEDYA